MQGWPSAPRPPLTGLSRPPPKLLSGLLGFLPLLPDLVVVTACSGSVSLTIKG